MEISSSIKFFRRAIFTHPLRHPTCRYPEPQLLKMDDTTTLPAVLKEFLNELQISGTIEAIPEEISCKLFWKFVDSDGLQDDLLFFVSDNKEIRVCRHVHNERPSLTIKVDWKLTLALNLICQMNFRLRITSCSYKDGDIPGMSHLIIEESSNKKVYASPLEAHLDKFYGSVESFSSHKESKYSFPFIYFSVQDYETCFENMKLGSDEILIVELFLAGKSGDTGDALLKGSFYEKIDSSIILFQGAISNKVLTGAYKRNTRELGTLKGSFIMMSGPNGIGEAQLHAIKPKIEDDEIKNGLKKLKRLFFGPKIKEQNVTAEQEFYNCRLTFIRLHWLNIIDLLKEINKSQTTKAVISKNYIISC